jgi:hypothetical protein
MYRSGDWVVVHSVRAHRRCATKVARGATSGPHVISNLRGGAATRIFARLERANTIIFPLPEVPRLATF